MPASGSSSCTPSGVEIVRRSSYSMARGSCLSAAVCAMSPERFAAERGRWDELEAALASAPATGPERLGRDGVRRLGDALPRGGGRSRVRAPPLPGRAADRAAGGARAARPRDGLRALGPAGLAVAVRHARLLAPARGAPAAGAGRLDAAARARDGRRASGARPTPARPRASSRRSSRPPPTRPPRAATTTPRPRRRSRSRSCSTTSR